MFLITFLQDAVTRVNVSVKKVRFAARRASTWQALQTIFRCYVEQKGSGILCLDNNSDLAWKEHQGQDKFFNEVN